MKLSGFNGCSAFGALLPSGDCVVRDRWRGKGPSGQAYALRWSGRPVGPTALRCSVSWPRRRTHCAHFVRCVQTAATSQLLMRAARAATSPALLGAPEAHSGLPERAFAEPVFVRVERATTRASRQALFGAGDAQHRPPPRELPTGTDCRKAGAPLQSSRSQTAATPRKQTARVRFGVKQRASCTAQRSR